jgi:hypothetical protein
MMAEQENGVWDDAFPLDVKGVLDGRSGVRVVDVTIANVPPGARLSVGTDDGDGRWLLAEAELEGLSVSPPAQGAGKTILTISLRVSQEADGAQPPETVAFGITLPPTPGQQTAAPEPEPGPAAPEPAQSPENSDQAISIGEDGGVNIDGGEKLQW